MTGPPVLIIDLWSMHVATCAACDEETSATQSLPVDDNGAFVNNDYEGEWGGVPACRRCFDIHAAGGVAALNAFLRHYLNTKHEQERQKLAEIDADY